jgi:hypothetical protein
MHARGRLQFVLIANLIENLGFYFLEINLHMNFRKNLQGKKTLKKDKKNKVKYIKDKN